MANLTIAVPAEILKLARRRALEQGTSVNVVLRDYLIQFAGAQSAHVEAAKRVLELPRSARAPLRAAVTTLAPVPVPPPPPADPTGAQ